MLPASALILISSAQAHPSHHENSVSFYSEDVTVVNPMVMNHIDSLTQNLLGISPPIQQLKTSVQNLKAMDVLHTSDLKSVDHLQTYSDVAHDLGVCGGYAKIPAQDVQRIEMQLLQQQQIFASEKAQRFTFKQKTSPQTLKMLSDLSVEEFKNDLNFITQYPHRNAGQSKNTEIEQIRDHIVGQLPKTQLQYTVNLITHARIPQKSIHIQVQGQNPSRHIVLGGHIDSINSGWGSIQAPGADDNASGSTAIIQILKTIFKNNYQPKNTLNFFWYAGEELGLIGSADIAKKFRQQNTDVIAALQLDMLGVPDKSSNIFLEQDFSSPKLNQLLQQVASNYFPEFSILNSSCGYPCSDHSSWYQEKYPVVFPTSGNPSTGNINRRIHTAQDLPTSIHWDYALNVTKLSLAFILSADQEL